MIHATGSRSAHPTAFLIIQVLDAGYAKEARCLVAETFVARAVAEAMAAVALGSVSSAGAELARRTSVWLMRRTFQRMVAGHEARALRKWAEVTRYMQRSKELMSRTVRRYTSGTVSRAVSKWKEALVEGLLLRQQEVI